MHNVACAVHPDLTYVKVRQNGEIYYLYEESVHGEALESGNRDVPTCTDCHGVHDILPEAAARVAGDRDCEAFDSLDALAAAAEEARRAAPVIGDHRAPQEYREDIVAAITRRALQTAIERAGGRVQ